MRFRRLLVGAVLMIAIAWTSAARAVEEETPSAASPENMNATGLPIVNDPVTLRVVARQAPFNRDYGEMEIVNAFEDLTNVSFDWEMIPASGFTEKLNLILATNELPDAFWNNIPSDYLEKYGQQGTFIQHEGLIEQWAPRIMELFAMRPGLRAKVEAPDGHIYGLFKLNELPELQNPDNMYINKTWLDAVGLGVPTTTEEFHEALRAFNQDLNGNGDDDEIPFSFVNDNTQGEIYSLMTGPFGVLDNPDHLMIVDGEVLFSPMLAGYREGIEWFAEMFAEGLIDPESFTQKQAQYFAKGKADDMNLGVFMTWTDENVVGRDRYLEHYVEMEPLVGPRGDQLWNKYDNGLGRGQWVITSENPYPEISMRVANEFFDTEWSINFQLGPIGPMIIKNDDGSYELGPTPPEFKSYSEYRQYMTPGGSAGVVLAETHAILRRSDANQRKAARVEDHYRRFMPEEIFPNIILSADVNERLSVLRTDIDGYVDQMRAKWIVGENDVADDWDGYLTQLERMGVEEYVQIFQEAYDGYLSSLE